MSREETVGYFFLKGDVSIAKLERMLTELSEIENEYWELRKGSLEPIVKVSPSVKDLADYLYDTESHRCHHENAKHYIKFDNKIEIHLYNQEKSYHDYPAMPFGGRRIVKIKLDYDIYIDLLNEIYFNFPEIGLSLIPTLCKIGKSLDAYFGVIMGENAFDTSGGPFLFKIDKGLLDLLQEGDVPSEIREAFMINGFPLSGNASIVNLGDGLYISDGGRLYDPAYNSLGREHAYVHDRTKSLTLWGIDYLEEIIRGHTGWWFYFDMDLFNSLDCHELLTQFGTISKINEHGYFLTRFFTATDRVDKEQHRSFDEKIRPMIFKRMREEYAKLGLTRKETWAEHRMSCQSSKD